MWDSIAGAATSIKHTAYLCLQLLLARHKIYQAKEGFSMNVPDAAHNQISLGQLQMLPALLVLLALFLPAGMRRASLACKRLARQLALQDHELVMELVGRHSVLQRQWMAFCQMVQQAQLICCQQCLALDVSLLPMT